MLESQASWDSSQVDRSRVNYCQLSTLLGSSLCRGHQSEKGLVSVSFVWLGQSSSLEGHCVLFRPFACRPLYFQCKVSVVLLSYHFFHPQW